MTAPPLEVGWLDARETVTRIELAQACGLSEAEIAELVDYGALCTLPAAAAGDPLVFSAECLPAMRRAGRLRRDFDLDLFSVALLLGYLQRIDQLERQLRSLQAHVPFHGPASHREGPQPWREPHG